MFENSIEQYVDVVGERTIMNLFKKIKNFKGVDVLNINSTFLGGGVAEILNSYIPLMNSFGGRFGLQAEWRVLHGSIPFYNISKKIHNGLQGENIDFTEDDQKYYQKINEIYASYTNICHDLTVIHDPQPLPLIKYINQMAPLIWRCHIDLSAPNKMLWDFLKPYIALYDCVVVSREEYKQKDLLVDQHVIAPAIDPLSRKNAFMSEGYINAWLKNLSIPTDKPIISQISRMDKWKDPEGLLKIFKLVKDEVDCRLLFCYNSATDDPEGGMILKRIKESAKDYIDQGDVILIEGNNPWLVNAIQRSSTVVVQKSTKEGFCLAVTEALWKETPVVASNVGGIPSQIIDGQTGYLIDPYNYQGFADRIVELINDPVRRKTMGKEAKEFIRERFLITRLLDDYLNLFQEMV